MRPKKTLNFKREYKDAILSGEKTCTIRLRTNLRAGDEARIVAGGERIGIAEITGVTRKRVSDLTYNDAKRDGFSNLEDLLNALRRHYRDIGPDTEISVIRFRLRKR